MKKLSSFITLLYLVCLVESQTSRNEFYTFEGTESEVTTEIVNFSRVDTILQEPQLQLDQHDVSLEEDSETLALEETSTADVIMLPEVPSMTVDIDDATQLQEGSHETDDLTQPLIPQDELLEDRTSSDVIIAVDEAVPDLSLEGSTDAMMIVDDQVTDLYTDKEDSTTIGEDLETTSNIANGLNEIPPAAHEAMLQHPHIDRPESYDVRDDVIVDPFEQKNVPYGQHAGSAIEYFNQEKSLLRKYASENLAPRDVEHERVALQANINLINQAVERHEPLGVLRGIPLPGIFDLEAPPDRMFVWQLLPVKYKTLDPPMAMDRLLRIIRILRAMADDYRLRALSELEPSNLSYYRAAQILEMVITVLKRLWFMREGLLDRDDVIWSPEYQALVHLRSDWRSWVQTQITLAS